MFVYIKDTFEGMKERLFGLLEALRDSAPPERPALVIDAIENKKPIYYFGLGTNMLRSHLENRDFEEGHKIEILEMEPAIIPGYRLSFNIQGFAPLEPGMGALEPVDSPCKPLYAYDRPECHGALVKLTPENYEKVMRSEGIGVRATKASGYEEIVVTAVPYDSRKKPVQAVALRARQNVRLLKDPSPSARYMAILKEGAAELGLKPCYQEFLAKHPVQTVPNWLRRICTLNLLFTFAVSFQLKWRGLARLQSWFLYKAYVPSTAHPVSKALSNVTMATLLLPGACFGLVLKTYLHVTKRELPPFAKRFLSSLEAPETPNKPAEKAD